MGQESRHGLAKSSAPGYLMRLQSRGWPGMESFEGMIGKESTSKLTWVLAGFSFFSVVGMRASVPFWMLARVCPQLLARGGLSIV